MDDCTWTMPDTKWFQYFVRIFVLINYLCFYIYLLILYKANFFLWNFNLSKIRLNINLFLIDDYLLYFWIKF